MRRGCRFCGSPIFYGMKTAVLHGDFDADRFQLVYERLNGV